MDNLEQGYKVVTPSFEGPFSLLLELIESRKLFVGEISLAKVTEDYINYVNRLDSLNTDEISNFVVIAATLILIKSKSLLPNIEFTKEEQVEIKTLEDRLKLFETFSNLSVNVKNLFGKKILFSPLERKSEAVFFLPDEKISSENMKNIILEVLNKIPKKEFLPEVEVKKVISIEAMMEKLEDRIRNSLQLNFKDFTGQAFTKEERVVVIVGFLAMLEMVRNGIVNVMQNNNFEDMIIEKQEILSINNQE